MGQSGAGLLVLQVTDTHLFPGADETLLGVCTQASFDAVLEAALRERRPDLVIATGDLAQVGHADTYRRFSASVAQRFDGPLLCVPGNHDAGRTFAEILPCDAVAAGDWTILGVDTHVDDRVGGHVDRAELERLDTELAQKSGNLVVVGHHAPVDVETPWLDGQRIDNGDELVAVLKRYNVRAYVFGHVHQDFEQRLGDLRLLAAPSTCFQFEPGSDGFAISPALPGYRWLELLPDGTISTEIVRLSRFDLNLDLTDTKY